MTTAAIRKKLITYIAEADDKKVKGMYLLFEEEIEKEKEFVLTDEQMKILEEEREKHLNGKSKSYTAQEAHDVIRGKRKL
jgi:hypothetical protein